MARLIAALLVATLCSASAFAPSSRDPARVVDTALSAEKKQDLSKGFAAAAVASAYLISGLVVGADAALADSYSAPDFAGDSSTVLLSARSGGRAGGRAGSGARSSYGSSSYGAYGAAASSSRSGASSTTIVRPTTVIQSSPAVVAPIGGYGYGGYGYGYGYNPYPGLGLSLGINAIGAVGEGIREARQEGEIARSQAEIQEVRRREADVEARLRMMEQQQMMNSAEQQAMNQQQMMQMMQK